MPDEPEPVLHVWPGRWDLPTFTPSCLASVIYLQLSIPGRFVVEECTNPDVSPDGQLPYLTHGLATISSYPSIVKYVDGLNRQIPTVDETEEDGTANLHSDAVTEQLRHAQKTAWMSFVSAELGDLVACSFFTLRHNYYDFVRPAFAGLFPVPQRYYVPDRLRNTYRPRLEAAGLWSISIEEEEEEKRKKKGPGLSSLDIVQEAFGKEKVLEKAHATLDLLSSLLGEAPFFLDNPMPTALDALVAAHILLLTIPPFPNDLLRSLIVHSYASICAHARRQQSRTLLPSGMSHGLAASLTSSFEVIESQTEAHHSDEETVPLRVRSAPQPSPSEVLSSLAIPFPWKLGNSFLTHKAKTKSQKDKEFDRMRWAWFGAAALGIVAWAWTVGLSLEFVPVGSVGDEEEYVPARDEQNGEEEKAYEGNDEGDVEEEEEE